MSAVEVCQIEDIELAIPTIWRPIFSNIVNSFVEHDFGIRTGMRGVAPISNETAKQIEEYIDDYGETLIELSENTWDSSVCMWMGNRWDVLIDLWTEREGHSDLVLNAQVTEVGTDYLVSIYMVYVP